MPAASPFLLGTDALIPRLNELLRGEVAAVETYQQAIATFGQDVPADLCSCLLSHQLRVRKLIVRVSDLGGQPVGGSGTWGSFAKLVEGGAALFGRTTALAVLAEGEDHGLAQYRALGEDPDPVFRHIVADELLPEQLRSHALLAAVGHSC